MTFQNRRVNGISLKASLLQSKLDVSKGYSVQSVRMLIELCLLSVPVSVEKTHLEKKNTDLLEQAAN